MAAVGVFARGAGRPAPAPVPAGAEAGPGGGAPRGRPDAAGLHQLRDALRAELALHRAIEAEAVDLGRAVVARDLPAMALATQRQRRSLDDLAATGARVRSALASLAEPPDLSADAGVDGVAAALEAAGRAAEADALRRLGDDVLAAARRARAANARNAPLLRQALVFTNFALSLLTGAAGEPQSYTPGGPRPPARRRLVDTRV